MLDEIAVSYAVLSVSSSSVEPFLLGKQLDLATCLNEEIAGGCQRSGGRFRFFATIPVRLVEWRTRATSDALDELGASGIVALLSSGGHRLGDDSDEERLAELDRRSWNVFHTSPHR